MASDREDKWKKYFSSGPIDTKIKAKKGESVSIYDDKGRVVDTLSDGDEIHVPASKEYNQKYLIVYKTNKSGYVSQNFVAKPIATRGATENLGVRAETLTQGGTTKTIEYAGKPVQVKYFTSHSQLMKSILAGLKENNKVSEGIVEVFEKMEKSGDYTKLEWTSEVTASEINELGKYAGELIIGLCILSGQTTVFTGTFTSEIRGKITAFAVPDDPSFAGIDSFVIKGDKKIVPISSKYGVGAKASFFANLLPKAIRYKQNLSNSVLKSIVESAASAGVTAETLESKRGSKETLYWHGINKILGIKKVNRPYDIFTDIRTNKVMTKFKKETIEVINAIRSYQGADKNVVDKLPLSVTSFFSREIAKQLNGDSKSVEQMLEILSGKNFWQANLNINKWKDGKVDYSMVNSGKSTITITGSKAAIDDIEAKQGMVNYEVKLP